MRYFELIASLVLLTIFKDSNLTSSALAVEPVVILALREEGSEGEGMDGSVEGGENGKGRKGRRREGRGGWGRVRRGGKGLEG